MSFNGSKMVFIEGYCAGLCGKLVYKRVTTSTAKKMKRILCGSEKCKAEVSKRRHRVLRERRSNA